MAALAEFGAPVQGLTEADLVSADLVFQIGVAPLRIDVLTAIDAVAFDEAWRKRIESRFGDQPVPVLSREDLIPNKRAVGRAQDLADLEWLEKSGNR